LLESKADIICLQEVDLENFNSFFIPELGLAGYKGQIQPKSRANTMTESERKVVDGCATFYNSEKFALLDKHIIEFASSSLKHDKLEKTEDIFNRVMPKDNVALILCLENKVTGSRIIVANVHVTWAPEFNDVKLVQVAMLMEDLTKIAKKWTSPPQNRDTVYDNTPPPPVYTETTQIPVIIGGDFNSLADSGVYELLSRGTIANDHDDLSTRDYGNLTRDGITHPFSLRSAYTNVGELQFTNYTPGFTGVIDYIWYSTSTLNVTGLLGDIDKKYLDTVAGFPNAHFPSDHIPLQVEFQVKPRKEIINKPPPPDFGNSGGSSRR
jgi:CCR4-NOT transcription complex subunit 6